MRVRDASQTALYIYIYIYIDLDRKLHLLLLRVSRIYIYARICVSSTERVKIILHMTIHHIVQPYMCAEFSSIIELLLRCHVQDFGVGQTS